MEKSTPHCKLSKVKGLVEAGKARSTESALAGGAVLGLDFEGIVGVVMALAPADFYKSMTRRPPDLAGRVPAHHASRRGLSETDGH